MGSIGVYRWYKTIPDERFTISFDISFLESESKLNKTLTIILVASIIIAVSSLIYVVITPKTGEQFTEFYILGMEETAKDYPRFIQQGENAEGTIGIVNHEHRTMDYTIETWLVNQTNTYNETQQNNDTITHNMWFIDKITTTLKHTTVNLEQPWTTQWETNYSYPINKNGSFQLEFLLFTTPTEDYTFYEDYRDIAEEKLKSAYRELHMWIDVN